MVELLTSFFVYFTFLLVALFFLRGVAGAADTVVEISQVSVVGKGKLSVHLGR